jgi:hypothetical protein
MLGKTPRSDARMLRQQCTPCGIAHEFVALDWRKTDILLRYAEGRAIQ